MCSPLPFVSTIDLTLLTPACRRGCTKWYGVNQDSDIEFVEAGEGGHREIKLGLSSKLL